MISYLLQALMMSVYSNLKQTLCELGFTVNVEKSQLVSVKSIAMRLQLPAVKLEEIGSACKAL